MPRANYEIVTLGIAPLYNGAASNVVNRVLQRAAAIDVTTTATAAGSRPTVPASPTGEPLYARITALDGPILVAWGENPTASATAPDCLRIEAGSVEVIPVQASQRLSFLEVA